MAATRLRFFPPAKVVAATNGNGKSAVPPGAKAVTVDPRIFTAFGSDFCPLNASGDTVRAKDLGLGWYAASWLAYTCMRYRATKLIEAPLWIAEEQDGEEQWLEGKHPLGELLERPNPDMEMADLLELTSLYLDSTGAAVWVKSRDRGNRVGALYPFSGDDFRVETAEGRLFGRFRVKTKQGEKEMGPDDVVYFRNQSPADPHGHVAPMHAALSRLGIDQQLVESIVHGLKNTIRPSVFFEFDPSKMVLTQEQVDEATASMNAKFAGAKGTGRPMLSNARVRQSDMDIGGICGGELSKENEAAVCACFGLPPVVVGAFVGLSTSQDKHNFEAAGRQAYDNAILPTWSRMEKALTRALLREVDPNPLRFIRFDKGKIKGLQEDRTALSEMVERLRSELDLDERRAILGYGPASPKQREEIRASTAPAAPADDPESEEDAKRGRGPAQRKAISDDDLRRALYAESVASQEMGWQLEAFAQLEMDKAACLAIAERTLRPAAKSLERKDDDPSFPADPASVRELIREIAAHMDLNAATEWRTRSEPLLSATGRRAVERVSAELGVSFDLLQPGLPDYVQREAAFLVTSVTDTTKQAIRDALAAGLLEGESIPKLTKRIQESGAFARSRAELIARTEVTRATNGAQRDSLSALARDTGDRYTKRWLATHDARVRDEHLAMDGETRGVDEEFSNGLQAPGEPNCRCSLVYAMSEAA